MTPTGRACGMCMVVLACCLVATVAAADGVASEGSSLELATGLGASAYPRVLYNVTYSTSSGYRFLFATSDYLFIDDIHFLLAISKSTGKTAWSYPDLTAYTILLSNWGSIVLYHDAIVVALDIKTGNTLWSYARDNLDVDVDYTSSNPMVYALDTNQNSLICINGKTGLVSWTVSMNGLVLAVINNVVYVDIACTGSLVCYTVAALDGTTGKTLWVTSPMYGYPFAPQNGVSPNTLYINLFQSLTADALLKINSKTGAIMFNVTAAVYDGIVTVLPTGTVYAAVADAVALIDNTKGQVVWQTSLCTACDFAFSDVIGEDSSVAYVETSVYDTNTENVIGLNKKTGLVAWQYSYAQTDIHDTVIDPSGVVYYLASANALNFTLYGVVGSTGKQTVTYNFSSNYALFQDCELPIAPSGGVLYVVCEGNIIALQLSGSSTGPSGGAIAGAVIGSLIGVGAIAGGVWYYKRRQGFGGGQFYASSGAAPVASSSTYSASKGAYATL